MEQHIRCYVAGDAERTVLGSCPCACHSSPYGAEIHPSATCTDYWRHVNASLDAAAAAYADDPVSSDEDDEDGIGEDWFTVVAEVRVNFGFPSQRPE